MFTRRRAMKATAAAGLVGALPQVAHAGPSDPDLKLWYRSPATTWVEALPIGNGRLAAMVFGGIARERFQLNEDTLWSGGPYDPANPRAREGIPQVRDLIEAERWVEA